jgi:Flp pilus assembly protein TadG
MTTHTERGSVGVWLALASLVMMLAVGLAVDLGGQVHAQQQGHDLAAQAARAGGEQLQAASAIQGTGATIDPTTAIAAANAYLTAAGVTGTVTVTGPDTITVTVHTSYTPTFLTAIGINHLNVTGTATAHLIRSLGGQPR